MPHLYSHLLLLCSRQSDFGWMGSRAWSSSSGFIKGQRLVSGKGWTKDVAQHFSKGNWPKAEEKCPGQIPDVVLPCPGSEGESREAAAQKTLGALVPG